MVTRVNHSMADPTRGAPPAPRDDASADEARDRVGELPFGSAFEHGRSAVAPLKRQLSDDVAPLKRQLSDDTAGGHTASLTHDSSQESFQDSSNIWQRLLRKDSMWDSLNVVPNDDERLPQEISYEKSRAPSDACVACRAAWYEVRHFCTTCARHPYILLASLTVAGLVAGVGLWALEAEREAYAQEMRATAAFVARETATYFSNEFKRAFVPLYALREAVQHSGHFHDLATQIGRYPHLLKEEAVAVPGGLANMRDVTNICDEEGVLQRWEDLLDASTAENDLEGLIFRYRLMPKNVACLDYKKGTAAADSGMDMSNSDHPFWEMVTTDLFINKWKGLHVFGPFMVNGMEVFCTHLGIWNKDPNKRDWVQDGVVSTEQILDDFIDVRGTEVEAWGLVMSYLNWGELKARSRIFERFADVGLDFHLARREEDVDPALPGPRGASTQQFAHLASSERSHLLDESNSILIESESLHGTWETRVGITGGARWNPEWYWPAVACLVVVSLLLGLLCATTLVKAQLHRDLVESMMPKKAIKKLQRDQTVIEKFNLITVFYLDVVDSSGSAGSMSPVQIMVMLNDLFSELDLIAKKHGVYKVETVGNRYMVVGGAPEPEFAGAAAKRVALFALDAMSFVDTLFRTQEGERLFVRAGIATNPAVAGCVGKTTPRYCFFGDAVDVASLMERTSTRGRIQCSEMTCQLLENSEMEFVLTPRTEKHEHLLQDTSYWIEKASPCEKCFGLSPGSYVLDPCGHVLCAGCHKRHRSNVCPTCRTKIADRSVWTGKCPAVDVEKGE